MPVWRAREEQVHVQKRVQDSSLQVQAGWLQMQQRLPLQQIRQLLQLRLGNHTNLRGVSKTITQSTLHCRCATFKAIHSMFNVTVWLPSSMPRQLNVNALALLRKVRMHFAANALVKNRNAHGAGYKGHVKAYHLAEYH